MKCYPLAEFLHRSGGFSFPVVDGDVHAVANSLTPGKRIYIGLDVHQGTISVDVLDSSGKLLRQPACLNSFDSLHRKLFFHYVNRMRIVVRTD